MGILITLAVALAACSGGSKAATPADSSVSRGGDSSVLTNPAITTTTALPATTTTTRPEYSFDDSVPPPKLLNTGTDYVAILESLERYGNWLGAHRPDAALARNILAPGSSLLVLFSRDLTRLHDNRQRLIERVRIPPRYKVISATRDAVSMRADESIRLHETVDAAGKVTSVSPFPEHSSFLILLVLVGTHWRIAADDVAPAKANVNP